MKFLQSFFGKKSQELQEDFEYELPSMNEEGLYADDFLGLAANEGSKASAAIEAGKFDEAWRHYQEVSQLYLRHAKKENFTVPQTLALVGSVHRAMAKLLELEDRHQDALIHILYCTACSNSQLEYELKHYRPFFNRCKFKNVKLEEVTSVLETWKDNPDFVAIRDTVVEWKKRDNEN
jgi:hypothetical protein